MVYPTTVQIKANLVLGDIPKEIGNITGSTGFTGVTGNTGATSITGYGYIQKKIEHGKISVCTRETFGIKKQST